MTEEEFHASFARQDAAASVEEDDQEGLTRAGLLKLGAATGAGLILAGSVGRTAQAALLGGPQRGGKLRLGMNGAANLETLDPHAGVADIDVARSVMLYENLFDYAGDGSVYDRLAADYSFNSAATVWKIKVRPGVLFHDGSTLTAKDVAYSLKRITDPKNKLQGAADLPSLTPSGVRALDPSTVELRLSSSTGDLRGALAQRAIKIVKDGHRDWNKPNGTGPWVFVSWTRGKRSLMRSHDGYRVHDGPYLEELEVISIADPTARVNALSGGQIDALQLLPPNLVKTVRANPRLRVLLAQTGGFTPQTMRVDIPPFNDLKVRQAMRLLVDRKQLIANALSGFGKIGNDLFCPFDENYASSLSQRPYDPERARSLLKSAGKEGLSVDLYTSDAAPAMLESSTLIAQQAKSAGVTVNLDRVPADQYWSLKYLKAPFACSGWGQRSLEAQILQSVYSKAPYNETGWKNARFDKLTAEARRSTDSAKRKELYFEAQKMLYDEGGFIIWGFPHVIDAYSAKLQGIKKSTARSLGFYNFTDTYFS